MSTIISIASKKGYSKPTGVRTQLRFAGNAFHLRLLEEEAGPSSEKKQVRALLKRASLKGVHPSLAKGIRTIRSADDIVNGIKWTGYDIDARELSFQAANDAFSIGALKDHHAKFERALLDILGRKEDPLALNAFTILQEQRPRALRNVLPELLAHKNEHIALPAFRHLAKDDLGKAVGHFLEEAPSASKERALKMLDAIRDSVGIAALTGKHLVLAERITDAMALTKLLETGPFTDEEVKKRLVSTVLELSGKHFKDVLTALSDFPDSVVSSEAGKLLDVLERAKKVPSFF